jgi:sigma-54 dependent transcriptional regulator, flagellar regulatory protein
VRLGRFRSDLYYRLHVCPVRLPALRERRGDIAPLFQYFWSRRGETRAVEATVMQALESYAWMGNVRELENLVERVSVCSEGDVIRMADLPAGVRGPHMGAVEAGGELLALENDLPVEVPPSLGLGQPGRPLMVAPPAPATMMPIPFSEGEGEGEAEAALLQPTTPVTIDLPSLAAMAAEVREAAKVVSPLPNGRSGNTPTPIMQFPIDLPTMLRELENRYINAALAQTGRNKKEAAKLLGMGRTTLVEKLRRRASDRVVDAGAPPSEE